MGKKHFFIFCLMMIALTVLTLFGCNKNHSSGTEKYTVVYEVNGGEDLTPIEYEKDKSFTFPTAKYADLKFSGWYYDNGKWQNKASESTVMQNAEDVTLYARWSAEIVFDSRGGSPIDTMTLDLNAPLENLPESTLTGKTFSGWYYDSEATQKVWTGDTIKSNLTLYAYFIDEQKGVITKINYFDFLPKTAKVKVRSAIALNTSNISHYVQATNHSGASLSLLVSDGKTEYDLSPEFEYAEGNTYVFKTLSSSVQFVSVDDKNIDSDTTQISFTVEMDAYENVELNEVKHIPSASLFDAEQNIYTLETEGVDNGKSVSRIMFMKGNDGYQKNDLVTIDMDDSERQSYYKVVNVLEEVLSYGGKDVTFVNIEVVDPELEDIYKTLETSGNGKINLNQYAKVNPAEVAERIDNSEGLKTLTATFSKALNAAPSIVELKSTLTKEQSAELDDSISAMQFSNPDLSITPDADNAGLKFKITYSIEIPIKDVCKINLSVEFYDHISLTYSFFTKKTEELSLGIFPKYLISVDTNISNDFYIKLGAEIEFTGTGKKDDGIYGADNKQDKIDIIEQVKTIINGYGDNVNDIANAITGNPLYEKEENELEYVNLFSIPLGEIPIPVTNIITFSVEFNAVVGLGAKAGIYIDLSNQFIEHVQIANGEVENNYVKFYDEGFRLNKNLLKNEFEIDVTLKGKIGIRCGIETKFTVGILHTNAISSFYASLTMGPYVELTGVAVYQYQYDAVQNVSKSTMSGGIYLTAGLYFDVKIGADFASIDTSSSVWNYQYEIFSIGSTRSPIRFTESDRDDESYMVSSKEFVFSTGWQLTNIDFLNLETGEIVENKIPHWLEFEYTAGKDCPSIVTVEKDGRVKIDPKFAGSALFFTIHVKAKDANTLVNTKTLEKDVKFYYKNKDAAGLDSYRNYLFKNEYLDTYDSRNEILNQSTNITYIGMPIVSPIGSEKELPVRRGYYLNFDDLWIKVGDENWDKTLGVASASDPMLTTFILNWKKCNIEIRYYVPSSENQWTLFETEKATTDGGTILMGELPFEIPSFTYKKFAGYSIPNFYLGNRNSGRILFYSGPSDYKTAIDDAIIHGVDIYLNYSDETFTVQWKIDGTLGFLEEKTYLKKEYPNGIVLDAPIKVGDSLNSYVSLTHDGKTVRNVVAAGYSVDITQPIDSDCVIKITYKDDQYRLSYALKDKYLKTIFLEYGEEIPQSDDVLSELQAILNDKGWFDSDNLDVEIAFFSQTQTMPNFDYTMDLYIKRQTPKDVTVEFSAGSLKIGENTVYPQFDDGTTVKTFIGQKRFYNIQQDSEKLSFTVPSLKQSVYYDESTMKTYTFRYWMEEETSSPVYVSGRTADFYQNRKLVPYFEESEFHYEVNFFVKSYFNFDVLYKQINGNFSKKTLGQVLEEYNIADPVREDYEDKIKYNFINWGVDKDDYTFGTILDTDGNVQLKLSFYANYQEILTKFTVVFDADEGTFANGNKTIVKTGTYLETFDYQVESPSVGDEKGIFIGWNTERSNDYTMIGLTGGFYKENLTYYAVYSMPSPMRRIEFSGVANGINKEKIYERHDREIIYVSAEDLKIETQTSVYYPKYITCGTGENQEFYYFEDLYIGLVVDGDAQYNVVYNVSSDRTYYVAFEANSYVYNSATNKSEYFKGTIYDFSHYKVFEAKSGEQITAPKATIKGFTTYTFKGWYREGDDGVEGYKLLASDTITVTENVNYYAYYAVDTEKQYTVRFYANSHQNFDESEIVGIPSFKGASYISVSGTVEDKIECNQTPILSGYRFVGWTPEYDDAIITQFGNFTSNANYYAYYEKNGENFTITLNANGGKFGSGSNFFTVNDACYGDQFSQWAIGSKGDLVISHFVDKNNNIVNFVKESGTYYAVYAKKISSQAELLEIENDMSGNYVLSCNIDATISMPIGGKTGESFIGTFNGNGYKLSLTVSDMACKNIGLFYCLNGRFMNASVKFMNIGNKQAAGQTIECMGAIAGTTGANSVIENCNVFSFNIISIKQNSDLSLGNVVGINKGIIHNVILSYGGKYLIEGNANYYIGSAVGTNYGEVKAIVCDASGVQITISSTINLFIGGLIGRNAGVLSDSVSGANMHCYFINGDGVYYENKMFFGGFVGTNEGRISNCCYYGEYLYGMMNITLLGIKYKRVAHANYNSEEYFEVINDAIVYRVFVDKNAEKIDEKNDVYLDDFADKEKLLSFKNKISYDKFAFNVGEGGYSDLSDTDSKDWMYSYYLTGVDELDWSFLISLY